ncbi:MAG: hypothetical protein ACJ76J_15655 [Thermoanaerobaculia bacterium]
MRFRLWSRSEAGIVHEGCADGAARGGALDQCAGILFNLKPNGDYLAVRFNGKEGNLVLWTFDHGKRRACSRTYAVTPAAP